MTAVAGVREFGHHPAKSTNTAKKTKKYSNKNPGSMFGPNSQYHSERKPKRYWHSTQTRLPGFASFSRPLRPSPRQSLICCTTAYSCLFVRPRMRRFRMLCRLCCWQCSWGSCHLVLTFLVEAMSCHEKFLQRLFGQKSMLRMSM